MHYLCIHDCLQLLGSPVHGLVSTNIYPVSCPEPPACDAHQDVDTAHICLDPLCNLADSKLTGAGVTLVGLHLHTTTGSGGAEQWWIHTADAAVEVTEPGTTVQLPSSVQPCLPCVWQTASKEEQLHDMLGHCQARQGSAPGAKVHSCFKCCMQHLATMTRAVLHSTSPSPSVAAVGHYAVCHQSAIQRLCRNRSCCMATRAGPAAVGDGKVMTKGL